MTHIHSTGNANRFSVTPNAMPQLNAESVGFVEDVENKRADIFGPSTSRQCVASAWSGPPAVVTLQKNQEPNLVRFLKHVVSYGYRCYYCRDYKTRSFQIAETHMREMHEKRGVRGRLGEFFIPCYKKCSTQLKSRTSAIFHFHCYCPIMFHSRHAILQHAEICTTRLNRLKTASKSRIDLDKNSPFEKEDDEENPPSFLNPETSNVTASCQTEANTNQFQLSKSQEESAGRNMHFENSRDLRGREKSLQSREKAENANSLVGAKGKAGLVARNLMCPLCDRRLSMVHQLAEHYLSRHVHFFATCLDELKSRELTFASAIKFYAAKSEFEVDRTCCFVKRRRTLHDDGALELLFTCAYSWAGGRDRVRSKNPERACPAYIRAFQEPRDNKVSVRYCAFHFDHKTDKSEFWRRIEKSLHGLATLQKPIHVASGKIISKMNSDSNFSKRTTSIEMEDEGAAKNLDEATPFYWQLIKQKFAESGYALPGYLNESDDLEAQCSSGLGAGNVCRLCKSEFKNRLNLKRHLRQVHRKQMLAALNSSEQQKEEQVKKSQKAVRCVHCDLQFGNIKRLIQHYAYVHYENVRLKTKRFELITDYRKWRQQVMREMPLRQLKCHRLKNGDLKHYWCCKLSGKLPNRIRDEANCHCSAWMCTTFPLNSLIEVQYCLDHVAHSKPELLEAVNITEPDPLAPNFDAIPVDLDVHDASTFLDPCSSAAAFAPPLIFSNPNSSSASARNFELLDFANPAPISFKKILPPLNDPRSTEGTNSLAMLNTTHSFTTFPYSTSSLEQKTASVVDASSSGELVQHQNDVQLIGEDLKVMSSNLQQQYPSTIGAGNVDVTSSSTYNQSIIEETEQPTTSHTSVMMELRNQISILVRSEAGATRSVKVSLADFPLITDDDGRRYYAVDENLLVEMVSRTLSKQGQGLYEGDQLEILQ